MKEQELAFIAYELFNQYGLQGYNFELGRSAKRRYGCFKAKDKLVVIQRNHAEMHPPEAVLDTLKHEVAHAIMHKKYGKCQGHNALWKQTAIMLGCTPTATKHIDVV